MDNIIQELLEIREETIAYINSLSQSSFIETLKKLEDQVAVIGQAWSGSWYGYQANIYYKDFRSPPTGIHFSSEWGASDNNEWKEQNPEDVKLIIQEVVSSSDFEAVKDQYQIGKGLFDRNKDNLVSILEIVKSRDSSDYINDLLEKAKNIHLFSINEMIKQQAPNHIITRDSLALSQGLRTPAHIDMLVTVNFLRGPLWGSEHLLKIIESSIAHIRRISPQQKESLLMDDKIFIGHGGSSVWRDLKDFLQDRLKLEWEEFNRIPTAGMTTIDRLKEMLDSTSFAFLVMTGEDEQADRTLHARMNVIHEVGLFHGRLGFNRAIILLEEGCQDFSNISGLTVILFPKGNISAKFEEIRRVLERENII